MRKFYFGVLTIALVLSFSLESFGQFNRRAIKRNNKRIATYTGKKKFGREKVYSGVGFSLNALNYYGDLSPLPSKFSTDLSFTRPALGVSLFHRFGPRYTLLAQLMYGTLRGSDADAKKGKDDFNFREVRNLSFRNRIKELSVTAYFDLFENDGTYISRVKWTPYAFIGVAAFLHNPQAQAPKYFADGVTPTNMEGKWVNLQPLGTEGQKSSTSTLLPTDANYGIKSYSLLQVAVPFGVGGRFRINEVLDFWADIGFRYTFTDYLDDVSRNYVDIMRFKDNSLAQAMSDRSREITNPGLQPYPGPNSYIVNGTDITSKMINGYGEETKNANRGSKKSKDIYMVTSFKITYILGATFHRAKFR